MDRSESQMENVRPSATLKLQSKLPTLSSSRPLQETSTSDLNARTAGSRMPPPGRIIPSKHKANGFDEPPAKRKTLAELAGEPAKFSKSHTPSKSSSSISGFGSRPPSATAISSYRNTSNASTASSVSSTRPGSRQGPGLRQPGIARPASATARARPLQQQPNDDQESDGETGAIGMRKAWEPMNRIDGLEKVYLELKEQMGQAAASKTAIEEHLAMYKDRVQELKAENRELSSQTRALTSDLDRARNELHTTSTDLRQVRRENERELQDLARRHEREVDELRAKHEQERQRLEREREREVEQFERKLEEVKKAMEKEKDQETADLTSQHWEEMDEAKREHKQELAKLQKEVDALRQAGESRATESATEVQSMREMTADLQRKLDENKATTTTLRSRITTYENKITLLEQDKNQLHSKMHFLEGNQEAQSHEFTTMREKMEEAIAAKEQTLETLRREEAVRRKLNAMILELRGNIRVFVRSRPLLGDETDSAKVEYIGEDELDGCKEMVVHAPTTQTATGKTRNETSHYAFDRVFPPGTENTSVFEECKELIQSVVDGYNVSILSYGQTGSGKTYGMSGPSGIIPSSIGLLMSEMQRLKWKGWEYSVEAAFVEVYNETLNDLLGDAKSWDDADDLGTSNRGKKKDKHEIHHDAATGKTSVTNLNTIQLWPPPSDAEILPATPSRSSPSSSPRNSEVAAAAQYTEKAVNELLDTAAKNRRVAATKANQRSSRSHSVFILTLKGRCEATNEMTEGVLNLVDLAGSERLKQSGAEGNRMKETQAINKSLSSLGDVIASLGNKSANPDAHIPYRNSKLTYLLQSSLGGTTAGKSSRTLMLLHISPLQQHYQESKSSLMFGMKVHGTHIGTAKKGR